ncbi:type 1 glutamine amidotransferase domain-containing protein [Nonomuraea turcica]|uniref:type 1 glutamine amidotransferase domain-containing protein n=1 Tax=Nonomuraea sp. G32 TaxID=3067274 RepID=UPI00273C3DEB|nr:type 1 glutamine amidotransferase domain-containing protein [Nonomuraea sp. G32]MDP4505042.1 type 1 glutamine amidotransferase domain-containing protein [Nonomuraea sp. G32]
MSQVLVILTSHGQLGSTGQATGVGLQTFASPYYALKEAGVEVVVASPLGGDPPVDPLSFGEGVETVALRRLNEDVDARALLRASLPLRNAASTDYDGLFFAGGHGGMWDFPDDLVVGGLIAAALNAGKPVVAVCHGVAALCGTDPVSGRPLVEGRRVTALTNQEEAALERDALVPFLLQDRLMKLGAEFDEAAKFTSHVVVHGSLITGQNMRSADEASRAFLAALASRCA